MFKTLECCLVKYSILGVVCDSALKKEVRDLRDTLCASDSDLRDTLCASDSDLRDTLCASDSKVSVWRRELWSAYQP